MPYGKRKLVIDLTTIAPVDAIRDNVVRLDECFLPDIQQQPGLYAGYYGFHAQNALSFATQYADLHGIRTRTVVLSIRLSTPVLSIVRPETLADAEFIHFTRMSEKLVSQIGDFWRDKMRETGRWKVSELDALNWKHVECFMPLYADPVAELLNEPEFRHIKVFVYPARPQTMKTSHSWFAVGVARPENIESAHVRFEDGIKVEIPRL